MNTIITTPQDLQNLTQNYMTDAANYHRSPEEVNVFGSGKETQDAIPEDMKSGLSVDETAFLANYSKALIMQGLSYSDKYKDSFKKSDLDAMRYWFTGSDTNCLSQDPSFNSLSATAARAAFMSGNLHLQSYVDSAQDWAHNLFMYLTKDTMLDLVAVQSVSEGDAVMNKYCMLLDVLDNQDRNFSIQYIKLLRLKVGLQISYGNIAAGPNFGAELQAIMAQIINNVMSQQNDPFYQLFSQDVKALQDEYNTDVATEMVEQAFSAGQGIGLGITWFATSVSSRPKTKPNTTTPAPTTEASEGVVKQGTVGCGEMFKKIKDKCVTPKALRVFNIIKPLMTLTVSAYSIFQSFHYLMDWKHLSPASHAQAVLSVVSSTAQIWAGLRDIKGIIPKLRGANVETLAGKAVFIELSQNIGAHGPPVAAIAQEDDGDLGIKYLFPEHDYEAVDPDNGDTNEKFGRTASNVESADKIRARFGLVEKTSAVINVALNISTCICIGFQIKNDFERNSPVGIKVLDILNEVANSAQVVTGALETWMMVASVESAVIPTVGIVVAVLCVIINIIEGCVHHDPPADAGQEYLHNCKDSYISSLPQRPDPAFTYAVNPTQFTSSGPVTLTFSVTNTALTTQSNTTVNSIFFQFSVGSVKENLLAAPTLANPTTNTAATNPIAYAITNGGDDFLISGPPTASEGNNHISVKIQAKNSAGSAIPATGLTFTIAGTGNSITGLAQVIVNESANNRPDKRVLPSTDVQETLQISKV
ncbi:hypothetical protein FPANT_5455 [Fusarium pseudoanthophilum]|uniref:Uncharacterized protein n=1 Tax=Fusarium pseudoanthophilum TaxID=48495 RepID=A0A8H5P8Z7_9HYPO|nr:hypothetical protein FPANT_5455 [Fusarium pseudoanthophilum]